MNTQLRSLSMFTLLTASAAFGIACNGDDAPTPDAGMGMDATTQVDASRPDMGIIPDSGVVDSGADQDAGHYCTSNGMVQVGNEQVAIDPATTPPRSPTGAALTSCIDDTVEESQFNAAVFIRGCINVVGAAPSQAEMDELEFAAFNAEKPTGGPTDPSYDLVTWQEASPNEVRNPGFTISPVSNLTCPSGYQVDIGFDSAADDRFESEREYILRVRSSTTAGAWMPTYVFGVVVRNANISGAGADISQCTTQTCRMEQEIFLVRRSTIQDIASASGGSIVGAANLLDGRGTGYAAVEARDCVGSTMSNATAGFEPGAVVERYTDGMLNFDSSLSATSSTGVYAGFGFPSFTATSSLAQNVFGAVGITRDGACTEEFNGFRVQVYPDAVSVIAGGPELTLHGP